MHLKRVVDSYHVEKLIWVPVLRKTTQDAGKDQHLILDSISKYSHRKEGYFWGVVLLGEICL